MNFLEGGWKIGDIIIKEKEIPNYYVGMDQTNLGYIASVDRTFNPSTDLESTFLLEKFKMESTTSQLFEDFTDELVTSPIKELAITSNGSWTLTVTSAPYDQVSGINQKTVVHKDSAILLLVAKWPHAILALEAK